MGSLTARNPSLWVAPSPGDAPTYAALTASLDSVSPVDVVVIGAGIAGLSAALALVEAGASVVVVEADRVCSGVTAYTTAKVTSLHGLVYAGLAKSLGDDVARTYGAANEAGLAKIRSWAAAYGIDCDLSERAAFTYTTNTTEVDAIADEVEVAQRLGLPASFTTKTDLPFEIKGAVRFDGQAQVHPREYCLGVAKAFVERGGTIHEGVRVTGVNEGKPCTVRTESGDLSAGHVVLATQLPILDRGGFFAKCHPMRSYAIAARLQGDVPTGMYLSADDQPHSVRAAMGDEFVILGGEGHRVGEDDDTRERYRALESWARDHFDVASVDYRWSAQDYVPVDGLPYVGRQLPSSRIFVATGFKKWGMTNGTAAGIALAAAITTGEQPWLAAFDATRQKAALTSRDLYKENANVAQHLVGDRLGNLKPPAADSLRPGEAGIVALDGDRVAAFRDEEGELHAVSPACTHLGCLVAFNTAERTWDCPCHGSRFDLDGAVLQGPATADLERKATVEARE